MTSWLRLRDSRTAPVCCVCLFRLRRSSYKLATTASRALLHAALSSRPPLCTRLGSRRRACQASSMPGIASSVLLSIKPLGFPYTTQSPFLFAVYHNDRFPVGHKDHMFAPRRGNGVRVAAQVPSVAPRQPLQLHAAHARRSRRTLTGVNRIACTTVRMRRSLFFSHHHTSDSRDGQATASRASRSTRTVASRRSRWRVASPCCVVSRRPTGSLTRSCHRSRRAPVTTVILSCVPRPRWGSNLRSGAQGSAGRYGGNGRAGDLQWMTAGKGVVHGENVRCCSFISLLC